MIKNKDLSKKQNQTPTTLLKDSDVIQRVLNHIDNKTSDQGDRSWREPVANYSSQDRFEQELTLIRQHYTLYCPSATLDELGSYLARDVGGIPIVVTRGKDGQVRAFKNACRHRGVQVAQGSGKATSFVCPYHAWTYGLDGALRGVPHEDGFPDLKKCDRGLVPVNCIETQGLVFVSLADDNEATDTPSDAFTNTPISDGDTLSDAPRLIPQGYRVHEETEVELSANWKIIIESFLEGYHIRALHKETFYPLQYDNLNVIEKFGVNTRISYPYRSVEKCRTKPKSQWTAEGRLTYVYHLFPNVIIATHPGFKAAIVFEPIAVDKTKQITYIVTDVDPADSEQSALLDSGIAVANSGVDEDRSMVFSGQRGLTTNANEYFEFGLYESAIVHFHSALSSALKQPV